MCSAFRACGRDRVWSSAVRVARFGLRTFCRQENSVEDLTIRFNGQSQEPKEDSEPREVRAKRVLLWMDEIHFAPL